MLFGSEIESAVYVADDFWASPVGLSGADKECLIRPFILEVVLLNSTLSSILMYMMGVYWLHEGTQ